MANLNNHNFKNLRINLDRSQYWDVFLDIDDVIFKSSYDSNEKLISFIDLSNPDCFQNEYIIGNSNFSWNKAVCIENNDLFNIGYTGVDNGLINFRKDAISNYQFLDLFTNSKLTTPNNPLLHLKQVTGNTQEFIYPIEKQEDCIKLTGGFYQGFFMTECDKYKILPTNLDEDLNFAFTIKPSDFEIQDKTLNNRYPNNKGLFFYIGTRAENKWWEYYIKDEYEMSNSDIIKINPTFDYTIQNNYSEEYFGYLNDITQLLEYTQNIPDEDLIDTVNCLIDSYNSDGYLGNDISLSGLTYETDNGLPLFSANIKKIDSNNKFLLYDRTCSGLTADMAYSGDMFTFWETTDEYINNLFLLMNRTCTGYTADDVSELKITNKNAYKILKDLYNNALGFQIKDNGSIGFKYLVKECQDYKNSYKIIEEFSKENIVKKDEWNYIHIRLKRMSEFKMKILIYVNNFLIYVSSELDIINLRPLNDIEEKQETVPFNISLGGGTQGLIETIYPDYMNLPKYVLPLEKHFAGSFLGYIKDFKIFIGKMEYEEIKKQ